MSRHRALNELVAPGCASARLPITKEPVGLFQKNSRPSDGLTVVPWQSGKSLC